MIGDASVYNVLLSCWNNEWSFWTEAWSFFCFSQALFPQRMAWSMFSSLALTDFFQLEFSVNCQIIWLPQMSPLEIWGRGIRVCATWHCKGYLKCIYFLSCYFLKSVFIGGCAGSLLLCAGLLYLRALGAVLHCGFLIVLASLVAEHRL